MTKHGITKRRAQNALLLFSLLAWVGLVVPGSPAYLPSLLVHYSHLHGGHTLGYWVRALERPDAEKRLQAIFHLGAMGSDAAEAVPVLARILTDDPDREARHQAALALSKMAPASAAAVPALARALDEDEEAPVRMCAAIALSTLGKQAQPAVAVLIRAVERRANRTNLRTFSFTIQEMAALALGRATAGTTEGVAALTEALQSARTANRRLILARALGEVGAPAHAAAPQLRALLADDSPNVREAAKESLQKILGE
ncbi:MAG TPA: HEAT repeat domain-containing protein [Gemmataceae bacterium]